MELAANFSPPPLPDGNPERNVVILRAVLIYMFVLAVLFGMVAIFLMPSNTLRGLKVIGFVGLICLTAYLVMRRGHVTTAGVLFLIGMGFVITLLSITAGGSQSAAFSGYMCIVLMSGLLFGFRGSVLSAVFCFATAAGVVYAEVRGFLPPSHVHHTMASRLVSDAIFLGWIALLVFEYTRMIGSAKFFLRERVKELTALHAATQTLQSGPTDMRGTLSRLVTLIPPAYQLPQYTAARVQLGTMQSFTSGFEDSQNLQKSEFETSDGLRGKIEVAYPMGFKIPFEKAFLQEKQNLLDTLADMLVIEYERRSAHAALRESESRLRELFDTARDTVYHLSPSGDIESLNPAFEVITGWPREEWLGAPFFSLIHPEDIRRVKRHFRKAMSGQESPLYEARVLTKTSEYVNAEFLGVPRFAEGKVVGVLGVARDITERRRLEEQVHRTKRMESIGMLAGGIAHDINNVLTPILLSSEMLGKRLENEKMRRMAVAITTAATRGSEIVKQILTFARGGANRSQPLQLTHLILEMEIFVRETFPRTIDIHFDTPDSLPFILGDATQIHQVFMNFCVNARDAMPGGGRLTVSAAVQRIDADSAKVDLPPGEYVVLTVADTGIGIPTGIRDKIFDPFFTTKELGAGTGLGLSTCLSIVRTHNGFIQLESEPERGTRFIVFFPTMVEDAALETHERHVVPMGNGETILIVDDEQASVFFVREILETNGYSVQIARDGSEGLAVFDRLPLGEVMLVISDIDMPKMSGFEFLERLRERDSRLKILLTSGSISVVNEAGRTEASAFLSKPYTSEQLLESVTNLLRR